MGGKRAKVTVERERKKGEWKRRERKRNKHNLLKK
jgi:hypothetical protein